MGCYHPQEAVLVGVNKDGKKQIRFTGAPYTLESKKVDPTAMAIPCGRCVGCRLEYSRQWADRMILELDHSKKGLFLTLTYDNAHVPFGMVDDDGLPLSFSLDKRDMSRFMKDLRGRKRFENREIRFYGSGEYGSHTFRPHYHLILFGIGIDDFKEEELIPHGRNELGQQYYEIPFIADVWHRGFVLASDISWKTCAYVARYVMKKVGVDLNLLFAELNVESEFSLMSRRPGIGSYFFVDHPDAVHKTKVFVSDQDGAKEVWLPKYLVKKIEAIDPKYYSDLKIQRAKFQDDKMLLKLSNTDLSYVEYLEKEEQKKVASISSLRRE